MNRNFLLGLLAGAVVTAAFAFAQSAPAALTPTTRAICVLQPRSGSNVTGKVMFFAEEGGVRIEAELQNLTPGLHGFHVHEWGDLDCADGKCTGGHFNPTGANHGGPDSETRHVGDLGNIEANDAGVAKYSRVDRHLSLDGIHSIIGRGLIVHADPDDLTSQPTGNAGGRIAAGVIGIADPKK
jgi:superoxide dismutase, Cu-Zn family